MTQRQKKTRAKKEMNKFDLWMMKIKNVNFSDNVRMSIAYKRVYENFLT